MQSAFKTTAKSSPGTRFLSTSDDLAEELEKLAHATQSSLGQLRKLPISSATACNGQ